MLKWRDRSWWQAVTEKKNLRSGPSAGYAATKNLRHATTGVRLAYEDVFARIYGLKWKEEALQDPSRWRSLNARPRRLHS